MNSAYVWVHAYVHALCALLHGKWVHEDRRSVYVYTEVKPDRVTCHFCVFAVCGNVPMEKALVVLMLPFTPVFSPLLWHETEENPLSPSVCVCLRPRTSSPPMLPREVFVARRTPDWQAYRTPTLKCATHMPLHTHTCFCTRGFHIYERGRTRAQAYFNDTCIPRPTLLS